MSILQDRMRDPVHLGPLEGAFSGAVGNPACGDVLKMHVRVAGGRIEEAHFESLGSPYQYATASVLCDCVQGQTVEQARRRSPACVLEKLPDLPERSRYLARLAIEALGLALDAAEGKGRVQAGGAVETRTLLDEAQGEAFVRAALSEGPMPTVEVEARARAAGVLLPVSTAKTLSRLAEAGVVSAAMDVGRKVTVWRLEAQGGSATDLPVDGPRVL